MCGLSTGRDVVFSSSPSSHFMFDFPQLKLLREMFWSVPNDGFSRSIYVGQRTEKNTLSEWI